MIDAIAQTHDAAAALADWLQAIAFAVGAFGIFRYVVEKRLQRQAAARSLYGDFMKESVEHPELYGGAWSDGTLDDKRDRQKYIHYIAGFLWAAEEILREFASPEKPQHAEWRETIRVTVREHRDYFASDEFERERMGYSEELRELIGAVLRERPLDSRRVAKSRVASPTPRRVTRKAA